MLKWAPYPFIRYAFFLGAGILTYLYVGQKPEFVLPLLAFFVGAFVLLLLLARQYKSQDLNNIAGIFALLALFATGFLLTHYRTAKTNPHNLLHLKAPVTHYVGVLDDYLVQKPKSINSTLRILKVKTGNSWQAASGNIKVNFKKSKSATALRYSDVLLVQGVPDLVKPPANPAQFNYQKYLATQQIYHQQYLNPEQYAIIDQVRSNTFIAASLKIRNYLDEQLHQNIKSQREYAIAAALVLGIRDYLPDDIKTTYASTGTMHVLAVSGLHVASLFYILNLLIGSWSQRRGYKWLGFIILFSFIWVYAFITALSASVLRAVIMFSFILVGNTFRRQTNIYNTLSVAGFLLLLYNPYYLLQVGFQLSFLAVFGIVYLEPKISSWLEPDNWLLNKIWKLISTSLAAQIAVLPLSLFYFHQFPVYFLIANIMIVPLANVGLLLGFGVLGFCWLPWVSQSLGYLLENLLSLMSLLGNWLLNWPLAVISGVDISPAQAWLLYGLLLLLLLFLASKRLFYFALFTFILVVFSGIQLAEANEQRKNQLLVIYQIPKATAISVISGSQAILLADSAFYSKSNNFIYNVQTHWWKLNVKESFADTLTQGQRLFKGNPAVSVSASSLLLKWHQHKIMLCRKRVEETVLNQSKPDYLILSQNAYVPANAFAVLQNSQVILDGSNNNWYNQKMKERFMHAHIAVYDIKEEGAFILRKE
ncbi:ComEC/Rec2 family competence protein [Adhaeribacter aquaticus]|uniref:ComEC/Rec2 family competence protein n=1 Tax=Adhaeribacter aquaticus TaxID=299567 RepID=UPI000420E38E|nr:ComEC/Rec2 family competence protein [Adhaeribacter aquaticus]